MAWLATHMWLLLLGAFLLGLLFGWWIWRGRDELVVEGDGVTGALAGDQVSGAGAAMSAMRTVEPEETASARNEGIAPLLYDEPTDGPKDDLKKVKGIGPGIEQLLNGLGIFYYRQIAVLTEDHVTWVDHKLQFPGRITRENWIEQAKVLRDGGETEFAQRYEKGETPSSYHGGEKGKPGLKDEEGLIAILTVHGH